MGAQTVQINFGEIRGTIPLPDAVRQKAAEIAAEFFQHASDNEFSLDPVSVCNEPDGIIELEEWFPDAELAGLGYKVLGYGEWVMTYDVEQHVDTHGPVLFWVLHNDGLKFKQGKFSHVTKPGEWFIFDDLKLHGVKSTSKSTTYLGWSVRLQKI